MTLSMQITAAGPVVPDYPSLLADVQAQFRSIYGSDIDIDPDTQDGQMLAIFARAYYDANQMGLAVYNSFSPATAVGTGLSSVVKINGLTRQIPTASSVDVSIVGVAGTIITGGIVADLNGNQYLLPALVNIPLSGEVTVTAVAVDLGDINSPANTVTQIINPQPGWQTVNNVLASVPGAPVETDAALRKRQAISTELPSQTIFEGAVAAVAQLTGVTEISGFENDEDGPDSNGIPGHCISLVVEGGDAQTIANTIFAKKGPGTNTYGSTTETVTDSFGIPHYIHFYRPTQVPINVSLTVKALIGFTTVIQSSIAQAIVDYINGLSIGQALLNTRLYVPANLSGADASLTYEVIEPILIARDNLTPVDQDLILLFHEQANCQLPLVSITVIT